jgi:hypothetical protein
MTPQKYTIELEHDELVLITNMMNYLCHAHALEEFQTLMGWPVARAEDVLAKLSAHIADIDPPNTEL